MRKKVTVIDYGVGNLLSIYRSFEYCGADVIVSHSPSEIQSADYLVLPGVGAFENGMIGLLQNGLVDSIETFVATQRPLLGICLGMQMLLSSSQEFGRHAGLAIIPGEVCAIPKTGENGFPHKVPHIGWNAIFPTEQGGKWDKTILSGIEPQTCFYFVHSFTAQPELKTARLADSSYNGRRISAVVRKNSVYGCQFHPEKSGHSGLQVLKNFISLA